MRRQARIFDQHLYDQIKKRNENPLRQILLLSWQHILRRLSPLGGASKGNSLQIFHDGDQIFHNIRDSILAAEHSVWLETYIFASDAMGVFIRDALLEAARKGCDIIVLYDHLGSSHLPRLFMRPLVEAGARVIAFNPVWPWRRRGPMLFRDHRKIVLIDQKVGFCGGMNISKDYGGPLLGNNRFRDTAVRIEGPAVFDLCNVFLESLQMTLGTPLHLLRKEDDRRLQKGSFGLQIFRRKQESSFETQLNHPKTQGASVQILGSNRHRQLRAIQKAMEETLKRAVSYCYFTTPYFLPYDELRLAMIHAQKRGVDVRILTAGLSDVPLMRLANQHVYGQFLDSGIRIYEMEQKTLHAKLATIDGVYATIGSYNLDHWSARRNLEVNVSIIDPETALMLKDQFFEDLKGSKEIIRGRWLGRSIWIRFVQWLAYQFMRL